MGALLFIAVFLASFIVGSGTGYLIQNQPGFSSGDLSPTPLSSQLCLPEKELIDGRHQLKPDLSNPDNGPIQISTFGSGNFYDPSESNNKNAGLLEGMVTTENWTRILRWLFAGEAMPDGKDSHPDINRRRKTWTLIKRDAPIPAWKIADHSGSMFWSIPDCFWTGSTDCILSDNIPVFPTPVPGGLRSARVLFHEATWIGYLDIDKISDSFLKSRYKNLKREAVGEAADTIGDIWVATGWCGTNGHQDMGVEDFNGAPYLSQTSCADPLIRDVLLVVTKKGRGERQGRSSFPWNLEEALDPHNLTSDEDWWYFDVYYDFGDKEISYNSLPEWMKSCGQNNNAYNPNYRIFTPTPVPQGHSQSFPLNNFFNQIVSILVKSINKFFAKKTAVEAASYPEFISGQAIEFDSAFSNEEKRNEVRKNTYIIISSSERLNFQPVGRIALSQNQEGTLYAGDDLKFLYLDTGDGIYKYGLVYSWGTRQETLKLGTFKPPPSFRPFTYEWYTPACKPAIYLYPEKESHLSIFLKPQGRLTKTDPQYENGWKGILAKPSGEIYLNGQQYPYLYYEAEIKNVVVPKKGWVVEQNKLDPFFSGILPLLGLNKKETSDFKDYWLKRLSDKPYYFVGLLDEDYLNEIEKVEFSQIPDRFIRIRFFFEGVSQPFEAEPELLPDPPQRKGFVAVDWGGMLAGGNCDSGVAVNQLIQ